VEELNSDASEREDEVCYKKRILVKRILHGKSGWRNYIEGRQEEGS
jgi:hypothetical protein